MKRIVEDVEMNEIMQKNDEKIREWGVEEAIQQFLASERAESITKNAHEKLLKIAEGYVSATMPEVKKVAEASYNFTKENYEQIKKDIVNNFKCRFVGATEFCKIQFGDMISTEMLLKSITANNYENSCRDLTEVADIIVKELGDDMLKAIYKHYVPEGVPEEVADFLRMIAGGGTIIPIQAVFPDIFNEEDE